MLKMLQHLCTYLCYTKIGVHEEEMEVLLKMTAMFRDLFLQ